MKLKEEGNVRYRSADYSGAISKYKLALTQLSDAGCSLLPQLTDNQTDHINRLLVDCHNNLAGSSTSLLTCIIISAILSVCQLVSWSLTSLFSTNMAISETNGHSL